MRLILFIFIKLAVGNSLFAQSAAGCAEVKSGAAVATLVSKDSLYHAALTNIKNAYVLDGHEHCISFGKDTAGHIIASAILKGSAISGKVPAIANAFADLHNHPDNMPPDAGDLYGLIGINKSNHNYKTRFVLTRDGTLYALLVTDTTRALAFCLKYPPQPPAFAGGPPGLPVALVDESREMKYQYQCSDELVMAFILEKYNTGVSLLKQQPNGNFNKLISTVSKNNGVLIFSIGICP